MNAPSEIPKLLRDAHRRAIDQANCWRGRCVNYFARGELVIGEALATSSAKPLPMLLSQRIARLIDLVNDRPKELAALDQFQSLASDRNSIVHGAGKVFVDSEGKWLLILELLDRSGRYRHQVMQDEAELRARLLKSSVDRLAAAFHV